MKRKWILAGALALVAGGALPWAVGYLTEYQWQQAEMEVNDAQPFLQMTTTEYRRGILGAGLNVDLVMFDPETRDPHRMSFHGQVTHGVTGSLIVIEPDAGWSPPGSDWFPEQPPRLTLETRIWGAATLKLALPAANISRPDSGEVLTTSPGEAWIEVSDAGTRAHAFVDLPVLALSGPDLDVRLADIQMDQTMKHLTGDVWTGHGRLQVAALEALPAGKAPVTLSELAIVSSSDATENGERLDSRLDIALSALAVEGEAYGPHRLVFALDDLEVDSWERFSAGLAGLQAPARGEHGGGTGLNEQMMAMQQVNEALRGLAAAGFTMGIPTLSIATPEGEVRGDAKIYHPELSADQQSAMLLVMQKLTGGLNLSMPLALAEQYPGVMMQVAPLIKQGLLVQEGDRLVLRADLKDLLLTVNGIEIPLPPLL